MLRKIVVIWSRISWTLHQNKFLKSIQLLEKNIYTYKITMCIRPKYGMKSRFSVSLMNLATQKQACAGEKKYKECKNKERNEKSVTSKGETKGQFP